MNNRKQNKQPLFAEVNRDLMILTERIRLLIVCNILLHLKFSSDDLVKILDNQQYMFIHLKQEITSDEGKK